MSIPAQLSSLALVLAAASLHAQHPVWVETDDSGYRALDAAQSAARRPQPLDALGVDPAWISLGPFGGDVADVAARPGDESVVLAGIAPAGGGGGALYRSTDGGANWQEVAQLAGISVHDLEFSAAGVAYAGTFDSPWRSADGGATWTQLGLGIGLNDQTFELTLDPSLPGRLWAGVGEALGSQPVNVLRSDDDGATWNDVTPPFGAPQSCKGIAVDPGDSNHVFACFGGGFGGGSVWRSQDAGASWTEVTGSLPAAPMQDVHYDGSRLWVAGGLLFGSQFFGLYESLDQGASWSAVHDGTWPNLVIQDIERDPANPSTWYLASAGSGVFRTTDDGASWSFGFGGTDGLSSNEVSVVPSGGAPVFLGSSSVAVWKSDTGAAFGPSAAGIGVLNTSSIAANPLNLDEMAVAFQGLNDGGVFHSDDGGLTWDLEALPGTRYNTVAFAPNGTLYAVSDGPTTIAAEGVWRKDPGGWVSIGPDQGPLFESELFPMAFSDQDPNLFYVAGSDFGSAQGAEATIWRTADGGGSWTKVYEGVTDNEDVMDLAILPDGTDQVVLGAVQDFGAVQVGQVLRSADGGLTWGDASGGLAAGVQATGLATSAFDPQLVFLADNDLGAGGVYLSVDGGQTWSSTGYGGRTFKVEADGRRAERLVAAAFGTGPKALLSDDGGVTFGAYDSGLGAAGLVNSLDLVAGEDCSTVLLATATGSYRRQSSCALEGDVEALSVAAGGTLTLDLAGGPDLGGANYWVVGSATGTSPATTLAGLTLPLVFDFYFQLTLIKPNQPPLASSLATFDPLGRATAGFTVAPGTDPVFIGATFYHAYAAFQLVPSVVVLGGSNAVGVTITP